MILSKEDQEWVKLIAAAVSREIVKEVIAEHIKSCPHGCQEVISEHIKSCPHGQRLANAKFFIIGILISSATGSGVGVMIAKVLG